MAISPSFVKSVSDKFVFMVVPIAPLHGTAAMSFMKLVPAQVHGVSKMITFLPNAIETSFMVLVLDQTLMPLIMKGITH